MNYISSESESRQDTSAVQKPTAHTRKPNFFEKLFSYLFTKDSPEEQKRKLLREIAKTLTKRKQKFYNPKKELALPGLASFIYEYYKLLGPAKNLIQRSKSSTVLRELLIESFLTKEQLEIKSHFDESTIRNRINNAPNPKDVANEIKEEIINLFSVFDTEKTKEINNTHNMLSSFLDLVYFDFYFFLKKFDSNLQEDNFFYTAHFEAINAEYILEDLKEFYDITCALASDADWNRIFDVLKTYRGVEIVSRNVWKKALRKLLDLRRTGDIELIIKCIEKNPGYKPAPISHKEKIVDEYLTKLKAQTEITLQKVVQEKRNQNINQLTQAVFGTVSVSRMKNYTEKANLNYQKHMMGGFIYVTALNYIKAFMLDYFKKDFRELFDLLLVRGKWASSVTSQQISDAFQQMMQLSDKLIEFDDSLEDEGDLGRKLKAAFQKADREKQFVQPARRLLKEVNDQAKSIIAETAHNLIALGKYVKFMIEDLKNKRTDMIINWKEIDNKLDGKLKDNLVALYKKIFYFLKLLQYYSK